MKRNKNYFFRFTKSLKRIKLIDRCLILFMVVLMCQSIYNLFSSTVSSAELNSIDVVIRTTSAGIFGYFLSANFIKNSRGKTTDSDNNPVSTMAVISENIKPQTAGLKNQIGFSMYESDTSVLSSGKTEDVDNETNHEKLTDQQVIIATIIGIVSLLVLIFARYNVSLNYSSIGTLSQMRDFVSGCVGFLLGSPTSND